MVEFLNLAEDQGFTVAQQASYRLILIYLGLTRYFSGGCRLRGRPRPNEVKHYGSASAFVRGDGPSLRGSVIDDIGRGLENSCNALGWT